MTEKLFKEKYPIHTIEILKAEMNLKTMKSIVAYYREKIQSHPIAAYIGIFDHYAHTQSLSDGKISSEIIDAKDIMLCFGKELLHPEALAVRPRSIGVAEMADRFVISFLEAPSSVANEAMQSWTKNLIAK